MEGCEKYSVICKSLRLVNRNHPEKTNTNHQCIACLNKGCICIKVVHCTDVWIYFVLRWRVQFSSFTFFCYLCSKLLVKCIFLCKVYCYYLLVSTISCLNKPLTQAESTYNFKFCFKASYKLNDASVCDCLISYLIMYICNQA